MRRLWCVNRYIVNNKMMMFSLSMRYIQRMFVDLQLVMMQKYWKRCLIVYWSTCVCICVDCVKIYQKEFLWWSSSELWRPILKHTLIEGEFSSVLIRKLHACGCANGKRKFNNFRRLRSERESLANSNFALFLRFFFCALTAACRSVCVCMEKCILN